MNEPIRPGPRLQWLLLRSHLLIAVTALAIAMVIASLALRGFHLRQAEQALHIQAALLAEDLRPRLADAPPGALQQRCRELSRIVQSRVTVVAGDGTVLADSLAAPEHMDNHADRLEIAAARRDGHGCSRRYSRTLRQDMLYLALRFRDGDAVIRVSLPLSAMAAARSRMQWRIALSGLALAAAAGGLSWSVSRRITRPLDQATQGARRLADGDLTARLPVPEQAEVGRLVATLNQMADGLAQRMGEIEDRRREQQTILDSMGEGLIAVDAGERIITVNRVAAGLLRESTVAPAGRRIEEAFRHTGLLRFLRRVLAGEEGLEEELQIAGASDLLLQLRGSVLRNAAGEAMGAVVVAHDVTRLRRLEAMRREFVANVSHELKTPVTAIRGFIETLQDGAVEDPDQARRFLDILDAQSRRLHAIIEDLLTLSRLEEQAGQGDLVMAWTPLAPVLDAATRLCASAADARGIGLSVQCREGLEALINAPLVEQAVLNLVDNAVKYGREGGQVRISAAAAGGEVVIRVQDEGDGIPQDHLARLFERFYRVDKARTRERGGTGLGLAIVKHIAQVHGGRAAVTSRVGTGSEFSLILPHPARP